MAKSNLKFTAEQQKAIDSIDRSTAILAGAGSGKTAVLIGRILNIVLSKNADLSEIAAITFTEKAAGQLVNRLTRELPKELRTDVNLATVTTIDGFCSKILREDSALVGCDPDFKLLEEHSSRILNHRIILNFVQQKMKDGDELTTKMIDELDFKNVVGLYEKLLDERWHISRQTPEYNDPDPRQNELQKKAREDLVEILRLLAKEKRRLGVIDFLDLEIMTLELLEKNPDIRLKYQKRFKHILVDEYQDTSDLQTAIIKHIYDPKKNILCIVGDKEQSIYRFRGANPEGILEMSDLIKSKGGAIIQLNSNFRSAEVVIKAVNDVFESNLVATRMNIDTAFVKAIEYSYGEDMQTARANEAESIASYISESVSNGSNTFKDIAVLFKSFTDIETYEAALKKNGIPYYKSGGRTFLDQPEIADIILCLRALTDPENKTYAYGLARSSLFVMTDDEAFTRIRSSGDSRRSLPRATTRGGNDMKNLWNNMNGLSISEFIREIVKRTNLKQFFELLTRTGQASANIEKLIAMTESLTNDYDYEIADLLDYLDDLKVRGIGIDEPPVYSTKDEAVKLLTVHAAKGLEFPVVILADLYRKDLSYTQQYIVSKSQGIGFKLRENENPIADREATLTYKKFLDEEAIGNSEEKDRLLYVATTRAENKLIFMTTVAPTAKSSWIEKLSPVKEGLEKIKIDESSADGKISEVKINFLEPLKKPIKQSLSFLTVSHIETFARCPREYYLKYILRAPSNKVLPRSEKKIARNDIGNIVHRAIAVGAFTKSSDWEKIVPRVMRQYGFYAYDDLHDAVGPAYKHLNSYKNSPLFDGRLTDPRHEVPFVYRVADTIVKGTIDVIYKASGGFAILDFKTDQIKNMDDIEKKAAEYRIQTTIYALAAKEALKSGVDLMTLYFLDKDHMLSMELSDQILSDGAEKVDEIIGSIKSGGFDIKGDRNCESCPYHLNNICEGS